MQSFFAIVGTQLAQRPLLSLERRELGLRRRELAPQLRVLGLDVLQAPPRGRARAAGHLGRVRRGLLRRRELGRRPRWKRGRELCGRWASVDLSC